MIDIENETLLTAKVARSLPCFRNPDTGKPLDYAGWARLRTKGVRPRDGGDRVKLETIKLPRGTYTTREAVTRFIARLNGESAPESIVAASADAQAERELAGAGFRAR